MAEIGILRETTEPIFLDYNGGDLDMFLVEKCLMLT